MQRNPNHPSLRYRAGESREFGDGADRETLPGARLLETGAVEWIWIGAHAEYDQLVRG